MQHDDLVESHLAEAQAMIRSGNAQQALVSLDAALALEPSSVPAHRLSISAIENHPEVGGGPWRGKLLFRAKKSAEALVFLEPGDAASYDAAGRVELLAKNYQATMENARQALQLDASRATSHKLLAAAGKQLGIRFSSSDVPADPLLDPASIEFHTQRALALIHYELHSDAFTSVNAALSIDPQHVPAHLANLTVIEQHRELRNPNMRAALLRRANQSVAALQHIQPGAAVTHEAQARAHLMAKDYEAACAAAEEALSIDPHLVVSQRVLGDAHKRLGNYREAGDAYVAAAAADPESDAAPLLNNLLPKSIALPSGVVLTFLALRLIRSVNRSGSEAPGATVIIVGLVFCVVVAVAGAALSGRRKKKIEAHLSEDARLAMTAGQPPKVARAS